MNNALGRVLPQYAVLHGVCKDAPAPFRRVVEWGKSGPGSIPQPSSASQRWPLKVGPWVLAFQDGLQDNAEAVSYLVTKGNFTLCKESVLSLVFLVPDSLIPSRSWTSLPSMPEYSLVTNYHCWVVTVRISSWKVNANQDLFLNWIYCALLGWVCLSLSPILSMFPQFPPSSSASNPTGICADLQVFYFSPFSTNKSTKRKWKSPHSRLPAVHKRG